MEISAQTKNILKHFKPERQKEINLIELHDENTYNIVYADYKVNDLIAIYRNGKLCMWSLIGENRNGRMMYFNDKEI